MDVRSLKEAIVTIGSELQEVKSLQENLKQNITRGNNSSPPNCLLDLESSLLLSTNESQDNGPTDQLSLKNENNDNRTNHMLQLAEINQKIEELYINFNMVSNAVSKLETAVDDLEQYGRRKCLVLHGLNNRQLPSPQQQYDEFLDKIISTINGYLKLNIQSDFIDIAHLLPSKTGSSGKKPIIMKFVRSSDRNLVFRKKKLFANLGIAVTESLTKKRFALLKETQNLLGKENVWTFNGTIFGYINSKKQEILNQKTLYRFVETT